MKRNESSSTIILSQGAAGDVTKCYMCSKVYSSPRLLPCVHTFCLPCLERHGVDKRPGDMVACPLCNSQFRLSTQGFVGLPRNLFVEELAEIDKMARQAMRDTQCDSCFEERSTSGEDGQQVPAAVAHCTDCSLNLCSSCCNQSSVHSNSSSDSQTSRRHNVVELSAHLRRLFQRRIHYCDQHGDEPVEFYCFDCRTTFCSMCNIDGVHRIHKCAGIERAANAFEKQLQKDSIRVTERYQQATDEAVKHDKLRNNFIESINNTEQRIRVMAEKMRELITKHTEQLLHELAEIKQNALDKVDSFRNDINRFLTSSDTFLSYTSALRDRGTPVDIAMSGDDLISRASALQSMSLVTSGNDYRLPDLLFHPCSAMFDLLAGDEGNIIGRVVTVPRGQDGSRWSEYSLNPVSVRSLHDDCRAVLGVAAMTSHVYVTRADSATVEVYSAVTWSLLRQLPVPGLKSPTDMVTCQQLNCLYISDWLEGRIHRVDLDDRGQGQVRANGATTNGYTNCNGNVGDSQSHDLDAEKDSSWLVNDRPWSLSLVQGQGRTEENKCSLLVTCDLSSKLKQFTLYGSILQEINLSVGGLSNPRHAILLPSGQFVVSFTDFICLVGADGKKIVQKKPSESKTPGGRINVSGRLATDSRGHLLVLDVERRCVLELNADNLALIREIIPCDERLRYPARLCPDPTRGRLYVADNVLQHKSSLSMVGKFWGKTGRVAVYDTRVLPSNT